MGYEIPTNRAALEYYAANCTSKDDSLNIGFSKLGELKLAMIDAFICEKTYGGILGFLQDRFVIEGTHYRLTTIGDSDIGKTECRVVRPGSDGRGGGAQDPPGQVAGIPDFTGAFSEIRQWVNRLVRPWKCLPDPEEFKELVIAFEEVSTHLRRDGGTLSGTVEALARAASHSSLGGTTIQSFQSMYVNSQLTVLNGLSGIAAVVASHLQAQQGLWTGARVGFIDIIEEYTRVFQDLSHHHSTRAQVVLRALQYASVAAKAGSVGGALKLAAATLDLIGITDEEPSKTDTQKPRSFSQGKAALSAALDALNEDIFEAERKIRETAAENISRIREPGGYTAQGNRRLNNRENYELQPAPITDFSVLEPRNLGMDGDLIRAIVDGPMRQIAEKLHDLLGTTTTHDEEIANRAVRSASVGIGSYGPSGILRELNRLLCDLLRDLKLDVEHGADQLWLAYKAFIHEDSQAAADLAALNHELEYGRGYDPWGTKPPTESICPQPGRDYFPAWWALMDIGQEPTLCPNPTPQTEPKDYEWRTHSQ